MTKPKKPPKNAIVLDDVVFKVGVREVQGIVHHEQNSGFDVFYCEKENIVKTLPFTVPSSYWGRPVTAWVRAYGGEVLLKMSVDDCLLSDIARSENLISVDDPSVIEGLYEEQLIRIMPNIMSGVGSTITALIGAILIAIFKAPVFPWLVLFLSIGIFGVAWTARWYIQLNKSIVYDRNGNWISFKTGQTSLNDGKFRYRVKE